MRREPFDPPRPCPCPGDWGPEGTGYHPSIPQLWPLGIPHPTCVSTIFALYNRPLHTINHPLHVLALCACGGGAGPGFDLQASWGFCFPESDPRGPSTSAQKPTFVIFLGGKMEDCSLLPSTWPPGLWPPRERAHGGEERGWPLSLLKAPTGLCWPQEGTETVLRVPGAAAVCFPVLSFMGRGPCKAWAALPEPRPGPHLGHSPLFALDSGRCMACQSLPSLPDGPEDTAGTGTRQPEAAVPVVSQSQSPGALCQRETC